MSAQLFLVAPAENHEFEQFWALYPRREAKKDARKAWGQMDPKDQPLAMQAIMGWRRVWRDRETCYIPLAATWLRGERYHDELPREIKTSAAAHIPFTPDPAPERTRMPPDFAVKLAQRMKT